MVRIGFIPGTLAAVTLAVVLGSTNAQPSQVRVGTLACSMSSSIGLILGSQKNVSCNFKGQHPALLKSERIKTGPNRDTSGFIFGAATLQAHPTTPPLQLCGRRKDLCH